MASSAGARHDKMHMLWMATMMASGPLTEPEPTPVTPVVFGDVPPPTRTPPGGPCSHCHTIKTPLWRKVVREEGAPEVVCNACGLYWRTYKTMRVCPSST